MTSPTVPATNEFFAVAEGHMLHSHLMASENKDVSTMQSI